MSSHVFIVHGDLTQLTCDARALPCDVRARPGRRWLASFDEPMVAPRWPEATAEWRGGHQRWGPGWRR